MSEGIANRSGSNRSPVTDGGMTNKFSPDLSAAFPLPLAFGVVSFIRPVSSPDDICLEPRVASSMSTSSDASLTEPLLGTDSGAELSRRLTPSLPTSELIDRPRDGFLDAARLRLCP